MKAFALAFTFFITIFHLSHAQLTAEQKAKSEATMQKLRQIDILTQVIPLVLDKDQLNKLLPVVEKARSKVQATEKNEASELEKADAKVTAAINSSIDKGTPPPKELLDELAKMTFKWSENRILVIDENTDMVMAKFKEITNKGQQKAAINSLAPQLLDPSLKADKMTDDDKLRFFIQNIFLDPQCYPVLVRLASKA